MGICKRMMLMMVLLLVSQHGSKGTSNAYRTFDGKPLCRNISADEAVTYGAVVLAANLSGYGNKKVHDLILLHVKPLSLGIKTYVENMSVVIPKNTLIPIIKEVHTYSVVFDTQIAAKISVYQGEGFASKNIFLGEFLLSGILPAPFYLDQDQAHKPHSLLLKPSFR